LAGDVCGIRGIGDFRLEIRDRRIDRSLRDQGSLGLGTTALRNLSLEDRVRKEGQANPYQKNDKRQNQDQGKAAAAGRTGGLRISHK
jgi:hypothetical protein